MKHFALTVCNFLLVIASIERYLANSPFNAQKCLLVFLVKRKPFVIFTILLFAFLLKATLYFEINIFKLPNCSNIIENSILVLNFNNNKIIKYQSLRFWTRNILSVILPFIVLAYCNLCIVQVLRRRRRKKTMADYSTSINSLNDNQQILIPSFNNNKRITNGNNQSPALCKNKFIGCSPTKQRITLFKCAYAPLILDLKNKQNKKLEEHLPSENSNNETNKNSPLPVDNGKIGVRIATRTLVMVVGCYLISNSLSTALNIWEYFDLKLLRQNNFHIYLMITDIAALLTICGCALRLPIYVSNDKRIRKAICRVFIRLRFGFCKNSKP
uniref:G-protein coupled receptors family 1 profile domain-containing protein n=1 Tax=Meloidogyne floridensis TaxID=298350 RepID=A0A915P9J0_9BILA